MKEKHQKEGNFEKNTVSKGMFCVKKIKIEKFFLIFVNTGTCKITSNLLKFWGILPKTKCNFENLWYCKKYN